MDDNYTGRVIPAGKGKGLIALVMALYAFPAFCRWPSAIPCRG